MKSLALLLAVIVSAVLLSGCAMDSHQSRRGYVSYSAACGNLTPQECEERARATRSALSVVEYADRIEQQRDRHEENMNRSRQDSFRRAVNTWGNDLSGAVNRWLNVDRRR